MLSKYIGKWVIILTPPSELGFLPNVYKITTQQNVDDDLVAIETEKGIKTYWEDNVWGVFDSEKDAEPYVKMIKELGGTIKANRAQETRMRESIKSLLKDFTRIK